MAGSERMPMKDDFDEGQVETEPLRLKARRAMRNVKAVAAAQLLFGENTKHLRLALRLSQKETAKRAGNHWRH